MISKRVQYGEALAARYEIRRFEAECREQLGVEFEVLEADFWAEVERLADNPGPAKRE